MNKIKALVLVAICVIALGGGVFTVSNAKAAIISEWTTAGGNVALSGNMNVVEELILEPNTSVEMYDLINVDGQTGNDSVTEISSGGASVPHSGQTVLDANNIVKDDILSTTDADYTVPMQDGGIVIVGNTFDTFSTEFVGTMAPTAPGTCTDNSGVSHDVVLPTGPGWFNVYDATTCKENGITGVNAAITDISSEEYSVVYNDAAMWQNGTTPYILDMKIEYVGAYTNGGGLDAYIPETGDLMMDASGGADYQPTFASYNNAVKLNINNVENALHISFTVSDTPEYGYAEAGQSPESIAGEDIPVNLMITDMESAAGFVLNKADFNGAIIPYCDVKYNMDYTIDTVNTNPECIKSGDGNFSSDDSDNEENDFGHDNTSTTNNYTYMRRGYIYDSGVKAWIPDPVRTDVLEDKYIQDQRTKVYTVGDYIGITDSWRANGVGYRQTSTNYQISTTNSDFTIYHVIQEQWFGDQATSYTRSFGHTIDILSIEEPIVSMAKVQEDTGIDGKGVNDDIVAPGETVHYRLYAINSGFDGETGYRFYDDVTNLLEYTGVVSNIGVKKITGDNFSSFLAEYTQYMNDPTLGDIPACGSTGATYTCEDVTAITNNSSGAVVDVTLNEVLPTQTAYELSFDVVVGTGYNGQADRTITNTGYLTEPGCTIIDGVPSGSCSANESVTIEYGSIALKITKDVNDAVDSTYTPSEGIASNGDTYASTEEWLNYTLTITNASSDGALNIAQDVQIVDDLTLDTNLSKIDPATIVVTSSIDGVLIASTDYTDASTATKLDITIPTMAVDETITITFKAQAL